MMKNKIKALLAVVAAGAMAFSLAACGNSNASSDSSAKSSSSSETTEAKSTDGGAGFEEIPIGDDQEVGPLNVAAVYFQPVDMYPEGQGLSAAEANLHLEADIHALKNNELGYAEGEFIPKLTVDYKIEDKNDPNNVQQGTFMEMNADDGPHYGANLKLDKDGEYKLTFTIHSPQENGWTLHVDPETGVKGRFWTEPLTASFDWDYTVHQW
ncbi:MULTISPECIES: iron transporter [Bifidobacterium]|uniref:Amino acid ABC transporter substrate-binding protein n=1 Tax=Bifidobacterium tissieri TaxID=1630162 RepID=A0A261FDX9_9BIFI|nr:MULTISPECIES: iron transporter [Bifidobacterium]KAA8827618.1 amino acid ABC transporter substrate-binding protein [Bifidobacterium tissieri]KAA8830323.1 amino acid ABC transporter substrate-binding protein [Bifidobacterium tissieri]OZG57308.1 amino acid ABC transporter substrate-binding protein [Bifidobacterium tissieri]TPF96084.1 amino acid ABC transporter substrate-binding protein [Bifidobacterium sp. UTCIF-39]